MAKKTTAKKASDKGATSKAAAKKTQKPVRQQVVEAAFALAAQMGWENVSLADVADTAGLKLADIYDHFEDKGDILTAYGRMVDKKTLENIGGPDPSVSVRDRLFDILMERFDILNDDRDAIVMILRSFKLDPKQAVISLPHLGRSMSWMLEAAGIETSGMRGAVRVAGLTSIYLNVLRIWKDDDSPDMSKTMAALDKNLGRAEQVMNSFPL